MFLGVYFQTTESWPSVTLDTLRFSSFFSTACYRAESTPDDLTRSSRVKDSSPSLTVTVDVSDPAAVGLPTIRAALGQRYPRPPEVHVDRDSRERVASRRRRRGHSRRPSRPDGDTTANPRVCRSPVRSWPLRNKLAATRSSQGRGARERSRWHVTAWLHADCRLPRSTAVAWEGAVEVKGLTTANVSTSAAEIAWFDPVYSTIVPDSPHARPPH